MKVYTVRRTQILATTIHEAWAFFSHPDNLLKITPREMGLTPLYMSGGDEAYPGQVIHYRIRVLPAIHVNWLTIITHMDPPHYFINDQRFGPYRLWNHQHRFRQVPGGVEMSDEVNYALPLGLLGRLAHWIFVERKVNAIFDYRYRILESHFGRK